MIDHATTNDHPPPDQPLRGGHRDRRRRVRRRPLAGRPRPPGRVLAPPAPAGVRRDRPHDVPRAPDRGADGARGRHARRPRGDRPGGRPSRRLPPAGAVREGVPAPPRGLALGLPDAPGRRLRRRAGGRRSGLARPRPARASARLAGARASRSARAPSGRPWRVVPVRRHCIGCAAMERGESRRRDRRNVGQMVVVGVIASALGIALGLAIDWFPAADSTQADEIDTLWDVLVIASVPVFVLVTTVIIFSVIDFRMRPGEENLDGPPIHGNTRLEVIWTAIPALVILGLCVFAYTTLTDIEKSPAKGDQRVIDVYGQQFTWTFNYDEQGKKFTSSQLYLPAQSEVKFRIHSRDVIHDFWVPDWRMKIDAVPGITTSYRVNLKPGALGDHDIVCAELCGLGHAYMRQTAHVVPADRFDAWVQRMSAGAKPAPAGGQQAGAPVSAAQAKQVFVAGNQQTGATACGACHTLGAAGN